ncbi:hypothetical protein M9H77_25785 [Catharanthus roseus]|uniref:Uncharacterized protein n=1 Tax=Catharanthus roseus TaxID=4058 RepID=A0ACC0A964_CATRO|nr:hypothetical protein M9H77_25785 [Catharanthus roseus]
MEFNLRIRLEENEEAVVSEERETMDRVERDRRARHARKLRKSIVKERRNKRRSRTTQINFSMAETYGKFMESWDFGYPNSICSKCGAIMWDKNGRQHNLLTTSEIAALIVGDEESTCGNQDVIIKEKEGVLKRITELHPSFMAMQYPILFPYAEDGIHVDIPKDIGSSNASIIKKLLEFILGQKPEDGPDIIARVFKIKLDELMKDLRKNNHFGRVMVAIYTIEFQKRGLPHAHILLFLHPNDKYTTESDIDRVISIELPDENTDPVAFNSVVQFMIHGPCGCANKKSLCMTDCRCSKKYQKDFSGQTTVLEDGHPIYRKRNNKRTTLKDGQATKLEVLGSSFLIEVKKVIGHDIETVVELYLKINTWNKKPNVISNIINVDEETTFNNETNEIVKF